MDAPNRAESARSGGGGYRFGPFVVDAPAHTLTRGGAAQALEPKAFAVLLHLLRHAGELVRHDELLDAVWGHRHVTPGVLTRAIAQLRHVLEDDSHRPQYIQTQHGLGYRFIGEIQELAGEDAEVARIQPDPPSTPVPETGPSAPAVSAAISEPADTQGAVATADARRPTAWIAQARRWGALAAVAIALALGALYLLRRESPPVPADASIAVLPFTSLSDDRNDSYFAQGLAIEMHDALAGVPGLKVAACRSESVCGTRGADLRRIGELLGVASVLDADVRRDGRRLRVNARLSDTHSGYTLWSGSYDRKLTGVFDLQREIAAEVVRSLMGGRAGDVGVLSRRLAPTRDVAAYEAYLKGLQQLDVNHDGPAAIPFFNEALAADAGFARAQAGICRGEIAAFEGSHDAAAYARAQAACKRAAEMDPSLRDVNLALGDLHRAGSEPTQAIAAYKRALEDNALRPEAYLGMARAEAALKHNDLALEYFERARQLRPGDASVYRSLGFFHYVNGELPRAIDTYRVATELEPNDEETWASYGGLCQLQGDNACASDAFMRSLAIKPSYTALVNLGTLRFDAGIYDEAAALYRRALQVDPSDYRIWGNLGDALAALPSTADQARDPYQHAAQLAQAYVDIKPQDAHAIAVLAWYRASLGEQHRARELIARAEALGTEPGEVAYFTAQASAALGDDEGARQRIGRALEGGVNRQRLEALPLLRPLLPEKRTQALAEGGAH